MPKRLANTFLIFALLVIAVLSWQWLDEDTNTATTADDTIQMAQNETDYYLEGFNITNVNNDKGQVYELSGRTLSHYFEKGNSKIEYPIVRVFSNKNDFWTGQANTGNLSTDFSVLELSGDVDLAHHRENARPKVSIQTQKLTIDTNTREMTANQAVEISSDSWSFKANQMRADVDNGRLLFNSGVEADYAVTN